MIKSILDCKVIGAGKQVIVFENGLGGHYHDWHLVADEISSQATIVRYHRAGYADSISPCLQRTTSQIVDELNTLLEEIGIANEIILVGHSFGGLCVQHFARLHPTKVKGVVLIDSTSHNFNKLYSLNLPILFSHIAIDKLVEKWSGLSKKTVFELHDLMNPVLSDEQLKLPSEFHKTIEEFSTNPETYRTMSSETSNWGISSEEIKLISEFPDIPLYVIARDRDVSIKFYTDRGIPELEAVSYEDTWRSLQIELSQLSRKGKFIIAEGSDHNIQLEKPDVVIKCIRELMQL